ncbi:MAG: hypothetical protein PHP82_02045 [Candidatus ainarchaeum sp.]|nr:hypothetical protein [Candidatus ainarchaeum sp.]
MDKKEVDDYFINNYLDIYEKGLKENKNYELRRVIGGYAGLIFILISLFLYFIPNSIITPLREPLLTLGISFIAIILVIEQLQNTSNNERLKFLREQIISSGNRLKLDGKIKELELKYKTKE